MILSFLITALKLFGPDNKAIENVETICLITLSLLYLLAYLGMIVTTVIVTKSDPTDPTVAFDR